MKLSFYLILATKLTQNGQRPGYERKIQWSKGILFKKLHQEKLNIQMQKLKKSRYRYYNHLKKVNQNVSWPKCKIGNYETFRR